MKRGRKKEVIELLEQGYNISQVCKKVGISRNTFYKWTDKDINFRFRVEDAQRMGVDELNDFTENQLTRKIREGNMQAIRYRLSKRHPDYYLDKQSPGRVITKNEVVFMDFSEIPEEGKNLKEDLKEIEEDVKLLKDDNES